MAQLGPAIAAYKKKQAGQQEKERELVA